MDGMAVADVGPVVLQLMKEPQTYVGKDIGLSTGKLTVAEYAAVISKYTGKTVRDGKVGNISPGAVEDEGPNLSEPKMQAVSVCVAHALPYLEHEEVGYGAVHSR